jgi:hypothetical protein
MRSPLNGSSLPGRLARYARVATVMGRFMSRLAGERYLGVRQDQAELARELRQALGRLRGPLVNVAQLLATVPGALPSDTVAAQVMTMLRDVVNAEGRTGAHAADWALTHTTVAVPPSLEAEAEPGGAVKSGEITDIPETVD